MKLEHKFLIGVAVVLTVMLPLAFAIRHNRNEARYRQAEYRNLQIKLDSNQQQLDQTQQQLQEQKKQSDDLQKQLLSKREEQAKLAAAKQTEATWAHTAPTHTTLAAGSCEAYRGLISQYAWNVDTAIQVCNAESGGDAGQDTTGDGHATCMGSRGLFQIGCDSTNNYSAMFDPAANIAQAFSLYSSRGWQPWGFTTCAYKVVCV